MAKRLVSSALLGSFGASSMVPSQLRPAKPVETLSMMPSRTEDMTTRAKTPRVRRLRVSSERSLCAHSSTRPPVTTSTPRLSWVRRPWRRRGAAWRGDTREPTATPAATCSLIAQRFHGREAARLPGRIESEEKAEGASQAGGPGEAQRRDGERHADRGGDDLGEDDAHRHAQAGAEEGHEKRLGHERFEDLAARGADGHLDAHLAHAV